MIIKTAILFGNYILFSSGQTVQDFQLPAFLPRRANTMRWNGQTAQGLQRQRLL
jgi:hypothetical protein